MTVEVFAAVVSVIALIVSVWTAYLQVFRRGEILVARPRGVIVQETEITRHDDEGGEYRVLGDGFTLEWRLVLSFANTGARARAIEDVRLRTTSASGSQVVPLVQMRMTDPGGDGRSVLPSFAELAGALMLPAAAAIERDAFFRRNMTARQLVEGPCTCAIEFRTLDHPDHWQVGATFTVALPDAAFFRANHSALLPSRQDDDDTTTR